MQCKFILGFETLITFLEDLFLLLEEIKFPDTNLSPKRICSLLFTRAHSHRNTNTHTLTRTHRFSQSLFIRK